MIPLLLGLAQERCLLVPSCTSPHEENAQEITLLKEQVSKLMRMVQQLLLLPMLPQLLDLISNKLSLLKHLTKPSIRKGGQTHLVPLRGKTEITLCYPCPWQISTLTY